MAKLYATIENSKGKTVSLSDNEILTATVYDGNMKAYSMIIEWTCVGDIEHYKCNNCGNEQEGEGFTNEFPEACNECEKNDFILIPTQMGAIVTTREWRNRPKTNDKAKSTGTK
jgi:hypothetical protein